MQFLRSIAPPPPTNIPSKAVNGTLKGINAPLTAVNIPSKSVNGTSTPVNGTLMAVDGTSTAVDAGFTRVRAASASVGAAICLLSVLWVSAGTAAAQCQVTQQATGTGQPFVFNQFPASLGQPVEIRIEWTDVVTAGLIGQRASGATNFIAVLCGARGVRLPGAVNSTNDDVRLCQTFFLNNNSTFSLALGVDTWNTSFQRAGASASTYVGTGTFTLTPTSTGYGGSVYQGAGPCPTYTPGFQPPCFNVPGSDGTFNSDFQTTRSISVSVTYTYRCCDDTDFNNNGVFPEDQDVIDYINVLAGAACPICNDIDFNNNGVFPEDQDVIDFFNVLAGGTCP